MAKKSKKSEEKKQLKTEKIDEKRNCQADNTQADYSKNNKDNKINENQICFFHKKENAGTDEAVWGQST